MANSTVLLLVNFHVRALSADSQRVVHSVSDRTVRQRIFDDRTASGNAPIVRELRCPVASDHRFRGVPLEVQTVIADGESDPGKGLQPEGLSFVTGIIQEPRAPDTVDTGQNAPTGVERACFAFVQDDPMALEPAWGLDARRRQADALDAVGIPT